MNSEVSIRKMTALEIDVVTVIYAEVLEPSYISFSELNEGSFYTSRHSSKSLLVRCGFQSPATQVKNLYGLQSSTGCPVCSLIFLYDLYTCF